MTKEIAYHYAFTFVSKKLWRDWTRVRRTRSAWLLY